MKPQKTNKTREIFAIVPTIEVKNQTTRFAFENACVRSREGFKLRKYMLLIEGKNLAIPHFETAEDVKKLDDVLDTLFEENPDRREGHPIMARGNILSFKTWEFYINKTWEFYINSKL